MNLQTANGFILDADDMLIAQVEIKTAINQSEIKGFKLKYTFFWAFFVSSR